MKHILSYNQNDLNFGIDKIMGSSLSVGDHLIIMSEIDKEAEFAPWIITMQGSNLYTGTFYQQKFYNDMLKFKGRIEIVITKKLIDFDHIKYWFDFIDGEGNAY